MMKDNLKLKFLICCLLFTIFGYGFGVELEDSLGPKLMDDIKNYKSNKKCVHSGDVYEHTIWVIRTVVSWLNEEKKPWVDGICEKNKNTLVFAAFLHDIGKCGDNKLDWSDKPDHPETGFEYLIGKSFYCSKDSKLDKVDFKQMGEIFGLKEEEMRLVAILIRMSHKFGCVMVGKINAQQYLDLIQYTTKELGYPMSEELIKMCILISAADVKGQGYLKKDAEIYDPIPYENGMFSNINFYPEWMKDLIPPHPANYDGWNYFHYDTRGPKIRKKILDYYVKNKKSYELEQH